MYLLNYYRMLEDSTVYIQRKKRIYRPFRNVINTYTENIAQKTKCFVSKQSRFCLSANRYNFIHLLCRTNWPATSCRGRRMEWPCCTGITQRSSGWLVAGISP